MKSRILTLTVAIISLAVLMPRTAQADEPTPGVARVSLIHGDVTTQRGDSGDWTATTVNAPLVRGDKISVDAHSRAEVELDNANILRLDQRTGVKIAELTRTRIQLQVSLGTINFTVFKGTEADVEIDTPNVAVHPLGEGVYRVQVNSEAETEVTVRKGEAEVSTPQGNSTVEKNHTIAVHGATSPEYQVAKARGRDEWDEWNRDRDDAIKDARSWGYANRYYTGAHDLDGYGHWVYVPGYDWCWTPYVDAGWVPYRSGRWVWEPYWGWTWVSYEPWGWAPYHYGRWFSYGNSWCWWPGYRRAFYAQYYPTWAPAYVSFIGFGFGGHNFNFGVGFGFGSIGWCPLGPYDRFAPWWGHHNTYNVVNITNITNVQNITNVSNVVNNNGATNGNQLALSNLQNALNSPRARQAITTVPVQDFVAGRIPRNTSTVDVATLRQAQLVSGTLPVVPTRESLRPIAGGATPVPAEAQVATGDHFFSRRPVTAAPPESFTARAAEIRQMVRTHNPLAPSPSQDAGPSANAPAVAGAAPRIFSAAPAATPAGATAPSTFQARPDNQLQTPQQPQRRWQRFGTESPVTTPTPASVPAQAPTATPAAAPETRTAPEGPQDARPAWRRFGGAKNAQPQPQPAPQATPQSEPGPQGQPDHSNWRRFSAAPTPAPASPPSTPQSATPQSQPVPQAPPDHSNWRRFSAAPTPAPASPPSTPQSATPQSQPVPQAPPDHSNWRRFSAVPTPTPASAPTAPPAAAPQGQPDRSSWRKFSAAPSTERPDAPREATAPRSFTSRPAPSAPEEQRGGWRQPLGEPRHESPTPSKPSSGWRQPSFHEAPQSDSRPPLEIRKPIVSERPQAFEGGGPARGGTSPPSGGRSAPSTPSHDSGQHRRTRMEQ